MARAPRAVARRDAGAPRRCPPLAAAPLVATAPPVNPAARTTAATASRLAAAAIALPLAAERVLLASLGEPLTPSRPRCRTACAHTLSFSVL